MAAKSKQAKRHITRGQPTTSRVWARWKWVFIGGGVAGAIALLFLLTQTFSGPEITGGEVPAVSSGTGSSVSVASADVPNFPLILYQRDGLVGSSQPQFHDLLGQKPVVLNYWASNCPPCRAEMPEFEKVWQKYKDQVLFVGMDVGRFFPGFGDQSQSKKELEELGITYVAGTPPNVEVVRQLQVQGLPSTVFITPAGKVHKQWVGILNASKLTELVEGLLDAS